MSEMPDEEFLDIAEDDEDYVDPLRGDAPGENPYKDGDIVQEDFS